MLCRKLLAEDAAVVKGYIQMLIQEIVVLMTRRSSREALIRLLRYFTK